MTNIKTYSSAYNTIEGIQLTFSPDIGLSGPQIIKLLGSNTVGGTNNWIEYSVDIT